MLNELIDKYLRCLHVNKEDEVVMVNRENR